MISQISYQGKLEKVNQYKLKKKIGQGSYGSVYLCVDEDAPGKQERAMKILDRKMVSWTVISNITSYI